MKLKFLGVGAGFSKGLGNNNAMLFKNDPKQGYLLIAVSKQGLNLLRKT